MLHETGTVKELRTALPDVPNASLYRHVRLLAEHVLTVVGETRIRGTVESVYRLNRKVLTVVDESGRAVQLSLLGICASFARHFADGHTDPQKGYAADELHAGADR